MDAIPADHIVLGTCGNCGGPVTMPSSWMGILQPPKRCRRCGATAAEHGPRMPMNPPAVYGSGDVYRTVTTTGTSGLS